MRTLQVVAASQAEDVYSQPRKSAGRLATVSQHPIVAGVASSVIAAGVLGMLGTYFPPLVAWLTTVRVGPSTLFIIVSVAAGVVVGLLARGRRRT